MLFRPVMALLILLAMPTSGCNHDYQVLVKDPEVIIEEVEVPVYIEVEGPTGTPTEDIEGWVDSFVQVRATDGVDIVWVIDQSGSMNAFQPELLEGIESMMNALPDIGWRLIMISTDPNAAGIEQQFPLIPGDDILDATDMYNNMETGSREMGFDAIYDYIETNPYATTWMRDDAALLVVFVSDEEDQSTVLTTPDDFIAWYTSRRFGNVFLASIVMRETDVSMCISPSPGSSVGFAYMEATSLMFGTIVDICSDDWTPGVTDATSQIQPYELIELSHVPVVPTIRVFVDTQLYNDWMYVESTNTVQFLVVPAGGTLVEVGYVIVGD